jgi:antitoxin YefM
MLVGTEVCCLLTRLDMDSILSRMKSITYTAARENLASTMNKVCEDEAPVIITRNRDQSVVMMSLAEYEALQETAYLMRSPANAKRLIAAVDALEHGKGIKRKLHA